MVGSLEDSNTHIAKPNTVWGPIRLPLKSEETTLYYNLWYFDFSGKRWAAALLGDVSPDDYIPLRIESACLFGHVFHSQQCDCGFQLDEAFKRIAAYKHGLVLYSIDDDARGLGIEAHFRIYTYRQKEGLDTPEVYEKLAAPLDSRDYRPVLEMLHFLEISKVNLLSNNKMRKSFLAENGISVMSEAIEAPISTFNMATMMLEKEDLDYSWSFKTHGDWLKLIRAKVGNDIDLQMAMLVKDTHILVASAESRTWNLANDLSAKVPKEELLGTLVVYLSDFPRIDELSVYARMGAQFIVLPFSRIPDWLTSACKPLRIKVQDWGRVGIAYEYNRPQWEPVSDLGRSGETLIYQRNNESRAVYVDRGKCLVSWSPETCLKVSNAR